MIGGGKDHNMLMKINYIIPDKIKVTGWKDSNTPILNARKPRQYSIECFTAELKTEQDGQGGLIPGYWNWMHVDAGQEGSDKSNAAKGNVVVL